MSKPKAYTMSFGDVYPLYIQKAEKKGRTKAEVDEIILWLTGYDKDSFQRQIDGEADFETFFLDAPRINPSAGLITGVICGHRVEEIEDEIMRDIRYLDKLIDELAKGRPMEKILRGQEGGNNMGQWLYVMFIERGKTYNKMTKEIVTKHVENLRALDDEGKILLVGAFKGYPGVAGMVVFKTASFEAAEELCKREPLVALGYATYKLRNLQVANRENNYLL